MVLALSAAPHEGANIAPGLKRKQLVDSLAKSLASLFLVKEGNALTAKHSMGIFQVLDLSMTLRVLSKGPHALHRRPARVQHHLPT